MPPKLYVFSVVGTHTEKDAVVADAINCINELFCNPKQAALERPGQAWVVVPAVLPHCPLKSQMRVAVEQEEVEGKLLAHAGKAGGGGAGVLLKVRDQFDNEPEFPVPLLSWIHNCQVPFAFWPLFAAPK